MSFFFFFFFFLSFLKTCMLWLFDCTVAGIYIYCDKARQGIFIFIYIHTYNGAYIHPFVHSSIHIFVSSLILVRGSDGREA